MASTVHLCRVRMQTRTRSVKLALRCAVGIIAAATALRFAAAEQSPARASLTFGTSGPELTYVVLGDSTAAGVGGDYERGIAVATARELAKRRIVSMTNLSVSGARIEDVRKVQLPLAESMRPDLVLLSAGANDVTHLTRLRSVQRDLRAIVHCASASESRRQNRGDRLA